MKWLVKLVGHCKAVAPIWDELGQKYSEKGFQFDLLCSGTRSHIQSIFTCCRLNIIKMTTDPPLQVTWSLPSWTQPRMRSKGWTSKDFQLSRCSRKKPTRKLNMSVGKRYYVYLQRGIKLCFQDKKMIGDSTIFWQTKMFLPKIIQFWFFWTFLDLKYTSELCDLLLC